MALETFQVTTAMTTTTCHVTAKRAAWPLAEWRRRPVVGTRQRPRTDPSPTKTSTLCSLGNARPRQPPPPPDQLVYLRRLRRTTPQRPCLRRRRRPYHCVRVRRSVRVTASDRVCLSVCWCVCVRARARRRSIKRTTVCPAALFCCYKRRLLITLSASDVITPPVQYTKTCRYITHVPR